jgi:hypothetical protein
METSGATPYPRANGASLLPEAIYQPAQVSYYGRLMSDAGCFGVSME